jgi:hypothetical protein
VAYSAAIARGEEEALYVACGFYPVYPTLSHSFTGGLGLVTYAFYLKKNADFQHVHGAILYNAEWSEKELLALAYRC